MKTKIENFAYGFLVFNLFVYLLFPLSYYAIGFLCSKFGIYKMYVPLIFIVLAFYSVFYIVIFIVFSLKYRKSGIVEKILKKVKSKIINR